MRQRTSPLAFIIHSSTYLYFISVFRSESTEVSSSSSKLLRSGILGGDMFLGACLASALVKLALRYQNVALTNEAMLIMAAILNYGKAG